MSEKTIIAWTDHTFNIAWGCVKISPGCKNCYADTLSRRYGHDVWGRDKPRRVFGEKHWDEPLKWERESAAGVQGVLKDGPHLVFCSSMCDVFEDHPTIDAEREKLWPLIRATPNLHWQLLTKRPERIAANLPSDWGNGYENVWLGTSVEHQDYAGRCDHLAKIPAVVRFVSYEPALGPVDLSRWFGYNPIHEAKNEHRRQCVSCGYQWGVGNRLGREDLEGGDTSGRSLDGAGGEQNLRKASRRARTTVGILANASDVQRTTIQRTGASTGMEAFQRYDSTGNIDRPHQRESLRQSTGEFEACDGIRKSQTQTEFQPEKRTQPQDEVDRCPSCGNTETIFRRRNAMLNSDGVWCSLPAHLANSQWSAPLITWTIYGGESGPGFRHHNLDWPRDMERRCAESNVAFFFKQSSAIRTEMGILLDGRLVRNFPIPRGITSEFALV